MDALKEKVFQFGIYGCALALMGNNELERIVDESWVEIVDKDCIERLKKEFTTECLRNTSNRAMMIEHKHEDLVVRMGTLAWKDYLTSGTFNFTSKEYFLIMDLLITLKEYVDNVGMRKLELDPKKSHYCINRLASKGFIEYKLAEGEEKKNFIYKVRVVIDENGAVTRCTSKNKKDACIPDSDGKKHMFEYRMELGLYDNIREMIVRKRGGIITEDLKERLGISSKIGYKLLNKIFNKEKDMIRSREFEGRVRRYRYCLTDSEEYIKQQEEESSAVHMTSERRIDAIKKLMALSPILQLDRQTYEKLQEMTGWKYEFDRRTIIRAAILAGFKIYKKKGKDSKCSRYVIARNECIESEIRVQDALDTGNEESMTEFQRRVYNIFVNSPKFVEMDNGYVAVKSERLRMIHEFLLNQMILNGDEQLVFGWDVIKQMKVSLLLSVIPFNRIGLRESLCNVLISERSKTDVNVIDKEVVNGLLEKTSVGEIMEMKYSLGIKKLVRLKTGVGNFVSLLKNLKECGMIDAEISCEGIVIRRFRSCIEVDTIGTDIKKQRGCTRHVCFEKRRIFFEKMCLVDEGMFYDEAYKYIYSMFNGEELDAMIDKLKVFKSDESDDGKQSSFERLYMGFKKNIIESGWLGTIDFSINSVSEVKKVLKALSRDKIIANYKSVRRTEFVTPHESFARAMTKRHDVFRFKGYHEHKGIGYFSHYFDLVYYTLATSGSLEIGELLSRVKFLATFEIELFLCEYRSVFKTNVLNGARIVSLGIFMDPFE
ncbi:hypothetical protein CWI42_091770 [Ordospora colligata]|nr:hypothetical protein CWI42_091770 [Ordospora colligata]